jgi:hypothetical protein
MLLTQLSSKFGSSNFREKYWNVKRYNNDGTKEIIIPTFFQADSG